MKTETIVKLTNIYKSYGEKKVLDDFNFEVRKGEFVVLLGKSGSGKSTILNIIGLLEAVEHGDISLFDKRNIIPYSKDAEKFLEKKIGYLFQNFALIEDKSVLYNMKIAINHLKIKDKEKLISSALEKVGLKDYENKKIFECSGGEQQRVSIARLLIKPCELILADEPTGSLDQENRNIIFELLSELNKSGKTLVVVTHDKDLASFANKTIKI